ncbi:MAG: hypothetical protein ACI4GZ_03970 [Ruminococcus sp.]
MNNSFNLLDIYGIPPARYSEDNPEDLFLKNLPSLEQIASFNLFLQSGGKQTGALPPIEIPLQTPPTPATTIGPNASTSNESERLLSQQPISGSQTPLTNNTQGISSVQPQELPEGTSLVQMITDFSNPYPITADSIQYLNGFIRTQIGRRCQIQFLVGTDELVEKDGFLLGVGANYILLNEIGTNDITTCDFYNIKFIRFLY